MEKGNCPALQLVIVIKLLIAYYLVHQNGIILKKIQQPLQNHQNQNIKNQMSTQKKKLLKS